MREKRGQCKKIHADSRGERREYHLQLLDACSQNALQLGKAFSNEKGWCHGYNRIKTSREKASNERKGLQAERERQMKS